MATTTPNFGWAVPTSSDLVKNGAVAIETLGDSIDASLVDLKGGTTGQVLSKTSNTDMDFTWASTGALTLINRTSFSAVGSVTVDSVFNSTYDTYMLIVEDVFASTTGTADLFFQFRYGSTTQNSGYYGTCGTLGRASTTWTNQGSVNAANLCIVTNMGLSAASNSATTLFINQVGQSSQRGSIRGTSLNAADADVAVIAGVSDTPQTFTGFVLSSTENMTGTVAIYGIGKA